ncbi:hypothetical protein ACIPY6_40885 [Streptomyces sp. NPDC090054]|uniref:hypothetical protein n=1 Tax=Streptomyces sp. NPDC090054 TaxID=3365933 RepID=UPI0037F971DB
MSELLPLCDDISKLSAIEAAFLDGLEEPAHEMVESLACELQRGHEGVHFALAQGDGERLWWLVWGPRGAPLTIRGEQSDRRLYPMPPCPVADPGDPDYECTLARSHRGGHSFEMEPAGPRTPSRLLRRRIAAELRAEMEPEESAYLTTIEDLLHTPGPVLPLITEAEAGIIAGLLRMYAETDWLVEDHTEELLTRIQHRLNALNPTAQGTQAD